METQLLVCSRTAPTCVIDELGRRATDKNIVDVGKTRFAAFYGVWGRP